MSKLCMCVSVRSGVSRMCVGVFSQVWRSIGWRVLALSVYGLLCLYEQLKQQQFVGHTSQRLRGLIPVCSAACSQQVHK